LIRVRSPERPASEPVLCCVPDLEHQALAEGGERRFELVEAGAVVEVEQAAHLARIAAEAKRETGGSEAGPEHRLADRASLALACGGRRPAAC
jgi:hypothetical protein